ncbi:histidine phosphatase family protein [Neobacillus niacini]|uniref:histidine phosphatase family protein n=1 Tax=Neobacillus niacini TaxID=86668 RepID=UPI0021CB94FE|nr:histidine phosphatase family protein [Neobacillus niacini]MCM3768331.1 histidine phosphatase family protein [Neobacillus niacini]
MKHLILIRHGEAEHLLEGLVGGWTDTKLTEIGKQQAKCTGERLSQLIKDTPFNFYTSDLSRAKETAEYIGDILGKKPVVVSELRELNNGMAANLSKEEAKKIKNPITDPILDWVPYPEAESWNMMQKRLSEFLDKIKNDRNDLTILVSHGNSIISLIHSWLGFSTDMFNISFDIQPCSITHLRTNHWNEKTISRLNDISHLENNGIYKVDAYFT